MGGAVRRGAAAGFGHRLLAAAAIRCRYRLDLAALALAGIELAAAARVASGATAAPEREIEIALAAYAVGVLGSTIVAATLALGEAWLTVALALHLPALGWIDGRFHLPVLRWLALGVAGVVLVRLVLNPYVLGYPIGPTPIFNWLLYGYGVPAASFIVATRQFGSRNDDVAGRGARSRQRTVSRYCC